MWRNADDLIGLPDIGVDFSMDVFELIQILERLTLIIMDRKAFDFAKRGWIQEAKN